jgi:hypothetical protein
MAANWDLLPIEVWAIVAKHRGIVGACQLRRVCKDVRAGCDEYLRTLPGLVVCGGVAEAGIVTSDALRLDLATMRWEPMPALVTARDEPACCAVRGTLVVLGGETSMTGPKLSSVEMLSSEQGAAFVELPPLSCGGIYGAVAIAVEESDSAAGQVLLIGGVDDDNHATTVQLVDLATGVCVPQPDLLHRRGCLLAAGRLPDGRIVCVGGFGGVGDAESAESSAEVWGPPAQGAADAACVWRALPAMSAGRAGCCGCVMSDGRFAVLGGVNNNGDVTSSCEALVVDDGVAHWEPLPPMHDERTYFACGAVDGCVLVAGGLGCDTIELYDAELKRWLRLPCNLPYDGGLEGMGSAVL